MASGATTDERVSAVRAFNRFYTEMIGVLREGLLRSPYSLTEARVIFELAQRDVTEVIELRRVLDLDPGYLSRILTRFEADGLATRQRSGADGRRQAVRLTPQGRAVFQTLDARSAEETGALLARLDEADQRRLVDAMGTIRRLLGDSPGCGPFVLRAPAPGDLGWIVHRHGALYAREYGWDETFEALVARIVADYVDHRDPRREAAWIAELGGQPVGCVLCVRREDHVSQLRCLLVEPGARGRGIGAALVDRCVDFARRAGYARLTLWTNDVLEQARRVYERAGFQLVEEHGHHSFGRRLVGQHWSRTL
ncbi:MAG: helix-turn-helix domain-containing GNAT family N-acetyltransferase [Actinomycetota bacterium]|nr:helix-turn-helix domain-containing GNAT family N-acetyltransferase [Actinomycetota bacterium]